MGITVRDLIWRLQQENQDSFVYFEGFEYYRVKRRGDDIVQIELIPKELLQESDCDEEVENH
jgi:hypothetical protein